MSKEWYVPQSNASPLAESRPCQFKPLGLTSDNYMNSCICRCCGEPMPATGNSLSRNPNICASCSSMSDGMEDSTANENASLTSGLGNIKLLTPIIPFTHKISQPANF